MAALMRFLSFVAILLPLVHAQTARSDYPFFRLPCGKPLVVERADPIVNPGAVASHTHTVMGGNGFGMSSTYADLLKSNCSTCAVVEDLSAYWAPQLYYQAENGTFTSVPQTGGALIYYLPRHETGEVVHEFPEGLVMLTGDPLRRSDGNFTEKSQEWHESNAVKWACIGVSGPETKEFPITKCPGGLRAGIRFPSCWDGKNLDSPNHKSHMAYGSRGEHGECPVTHPVRVVTLFYEINWSVKPFDGMWWNKTAGSQPFVLASGDPTGYSLHADFQSGWHVGVLQSVLDNCVNPSGNFKLCANLTGGKGFTVRPDGYAKGCVPSTPLVPGPDLGKNMAAMPGCNPVQWGPQRVSNKCTGTGTPSPAPLPVTPATPDPPAKAPESNVGITPSSSSAVSLRLSASLVVLVALQLITATLF